MVDKRFSVDARTILTLGRESIKDHTTAVLELVKNSYDADATIVEVQIVSKGSDPHVMVSDNGCGMSEEDIDHNWLRIGYSEKRRTRMSGRRRRKTGEKGIGRISTDRLGALLELRTKKTGSPFFGLSVNWDSFDVDGSEIGSVPLSILEDPDLTPPLDMNEQVSKSGTQLLIRKLRQGWSPDDVRNLYDELSYLTPPFNRIKDFRILFSNDVDEQWNGEVTSPFYEIARIILSAKLTADGRLAYSIADNTGGKSRSAPIKRIPWHQIYQQVGGGRQSAVKARPIVGSFDLKLLFYLREADAVRDMTVTLTDLRHFLDRNAGVKIYRDNIRVRPYGDAQHPDGDWLGLAERRQREPTGPARRRYKIGANQTVGAVFIGRDKNAALADSASREGLIHGEAYAELRGIVLGAVTLLEAYRHEEHQKTLPAEVPVKATQKIASVERDLTELQRSLKRIEKTVPESVVVPMKRALDQVAVLATDVKMTRASVGELMSQAGVLRGLATLGIASSAFAHETQVSIGGMTNASYAASEQLQESPPNVDAAVEEIAKVLKYSDRVSAWGAFALVRMKRDKRKRRKVPVNELLRELIESLKPVFDGASIQLRHRLSAITSRTFAMDIEAIVLNLLTNAYVACQLRRRPRVVAVTLKSRKRDGKAGFEIAVSDSGSGVARGLRESIWQPLFTTKRDAAGKDIGTGLGLTIVDWIVKDMAGARTVDRDPGLEGARFTVWIPKR